ncbi:MAG: LacI family transcriptional regulator, partial [Alphaproteobacteria bacterium]|nr:LacI family transcriptional regulator [Alphaproteobacteria bacterium]
MMMFGRRALAGVMVFSCAGLCWTNFVTRADASRCCMEIAIDCTYWQLLGPVKCGNLAVIFPISYKISFFQYVMNISFFHVRFWKSFAENAKRYDMTGEDDRPAAAGDASELRQEQAAGGRRRATLKDVAREVGVHISTVSRALNPQTRHLLTPEIVEKVEAASRQLDYRPNSAAYSLRTNRTRTIGVVVPDITNPVFPPIIRGVEDALAPHGYAAIVVNTDGRMAREAAILETLSARGVDGLVVASVEREDGAIRQLAQQGMKIVTVNRRMDNHDISSVINDETEGVRRTLTHLVALGHREIATIAGAQNLSTGQRRYDAFLRHAVEMGLDVGPSRIGFAANFNEADGERCMEELMARGGKITAVLCANDRLA